MHRQGQGPYAVRVRLQGQCCNLGSHSPRVARSSQCQGLARQSHDGHTRGPVVAEMEKLTGVEIRRIHVDKGYRGHSYENKFRVWISGQVRRVTKTIRLEMKRRAAIKPVIGHLKSEHRMDRNYLKRRDGDRATLSSPPVITSACSSDGWRHFCVPCSQNSLRRDSSFKPGMNIGRIVHRRRSKTSTQREAEVETKVPQPTRSPTPPSGGAGRFDYRPRPTSTTRRVLIRITRSSITE